MPMNDEDFVTSRNEGALRCNYERAPVRWIVQCPQVVLHLLDPRREVFSCDLGLANFFLPLAKSRQQGTLPAIKWSQALGSRWIQLAGRLRDIAVAHPTPKAPRPRPAFSQPCAIRPATAPPTGAPAGSLATSAPATRAIARTWRAAGLQPHAMRRYMASNDRPFPGQSKPILSRLYLQPPAHAAVFCVDEKSAIQALDRLDPVLPLSPGRAERHGFEYYRHGTLSLYAALETGSGEIIGKTASRHTSAQFVDFLAQVVATQPATKPIHIIADNLWLIKPSWSTPSLANIATLRCILPRLTPPGSIRSSSGSANWSAKSSSGASSTR